MIELKDQMNNTIRLGNFPKRIISLVPSQTELLFDLGLDTEVIGVTKFCIHPDNWFRTKKRVGGTKNVDFELIKSLNPDLIIANKEENTKEMIEELQSFCQVYVSDIYTLEEACVMISDIGLVLNRQTQTSLMIEKIKQDLNRLIQVNSSVLYLMWNDPYMVAGNHTFIGDVLNKIACLNSFEELDGRYKEISLKEIKKSTAEYLLLSSEPFPFNEVHRLSLEESTGKKVLIVDGEMFSWYGSRMLKMRKYFDSILPQFH